MSTTVDTSFTPVSYTPPWIYTVFTYSVELFLIGSEKNTEERLRDYYNISYNIPTLFYVAVLLLSPGVNEIPTAIETSLMWGI